MKPAEIRDLSTDVLKDRLNNSREELMRLRFQQSTGELTDFTRVRKVRREIARFVTILNEREKAEAMEGEK
jgi:large subunit ribosomal protein L29